MIYLILTLILFVFSMSGTMLRFYFYGILYGIAFIVASPFVLYLIFSMIGGSGYGK